MNLKLRLIIMNFLEFAVWGAYLTSMGTYLAGAGFGEIIGWFYSIQGVVSLFMPALMGFVADKWIQGQKLLSLCHFLAGCFMMAAGIVGMQEDCSIGTLFSLYALSVAFFMPTIALSNSVAFSALTKARLDTVKAFPPIRIFGTIGFICTMVCIDLLDYQTTSHQFLVSGGLSLVLAVYARTLPKMHVNGEESTTSLSQAFGVDAFSLFKQRKMAIFFIFSMLLGVSLQITNGYANPYITSFKTIAEYANAFGAKHANLLISLSQVSETCCILLIPYCLKHFGIKKVMMIAMGAWVLRFGFFGLGNPGSGVWLFVLSCLVYGVAFDFFNISGALFVDQNVHKSIRSSAQGLFMTMTNGIGATVGTLSAQAIVNRLVMAPGVTDPLTGWRTSWFIFAAYSLVVLILFTIIFRPKEK